MATWNLAGIAAALVGVAGLAGAAWADTVSITSDRDNTLYQDETGMTGNGLGESFFVGKTGQGLIRRGLIRFNIGGAVPAGATITGVTLDLNMSMSISAEEEIGLFRALKDWGEGTSVANLPGNIGGGQGTAATHDDATWLYTFYNTAQWGTPGGSASGASPDYVGTASGTAMVGQVSQVYTWGSTPGMVADVQSWLDSPASNFGWFVIGGEEATGTAKRLDSKDNEEPTNRPRLTITFTPPAAGCYANCDGSTATPFLNVNDFICFQGKFAAGDTYANCDGSTQAPVLNVNDFICFQGKFAAGCSAP
jgi:hypothetical protein